VGVFGANHEPSISNRDFKAKKSWRKLSMQQAQAAKKGCKCSTGLKVVKSAVGKR